MVASSGSGREEAEGSAIEQFKVDSSGGVTPGYGRQDLGISIMDIVSGV